MDRHLPAGRRGVVGAPSHGLSETAARAHRQVGRHGARRLPYPVEEYQQNNANLQLAIQTLDGEQQNGNRTGDVMGTRVWWDCKSYNN